jgi:hypothetical protein
VPLWLDLLARLGVTDADVKTALAAVEEWRGSQVADHLIRGVISLLGGRADGGDAQLAVPGISAENLARLAASLRVDDG